VSESSDPHQVDTVRHGSPFAQGVSSPIASADTPSIAATIDAFDPEWGVLRAAIWASTWVAMFAIACYQYFPGGGVLVTALGCGLAIIGLFSSRPIPASVLLIAHAGLFFACYQRLF